MAYENTQIDPDGKRRKIKVVEQSEEKNSSNQSGGTIDESLEEISTDTVEFEESDDNEGETELVESESESNEEEIAEVEQDEFPKHLGRGVYQLRSGEKVKGKAKAHEAQAEEDKE